MRIELYRHYKRDMYM